MIKACIFNLEGVILDTQAVYLEALRDLSKSLQVAWPGDPHDLSPVERLSLFEQLLEASHKPIPLQERMHILDQLNNQVAARLLAVTPDDLKDGVFVFIKELKNKGMNLAVVSIFPNTRKILNGLQITHLFHTLVEEPQASREELLRGVYLRAASELGEDPDQTIVFAHHTAAVEAAREAGFLVVGIGNPQLLGEADLVIPSLDKIRFLKIIDAIGG